MPLFSLIVPVYKTEDYLEKCVKSILNQKFTDFELILVDDGSPDHCPDICDSYASADRRIQVIHKNNGGVSSARNEGIKAATGQFLWFIDSDDTIFPDSLQKLHDAVSQEQCDLYVFNMNTDTLLFEGKFSEFLHKYYFTYLLQFAPWNKLYRRSVIEENHLQFDTQEKIGEDLLFNINYYSMMFQDNSIGKCMFLNDDLYNYVNREGSAMNTYSPKRLVQQMRLFDKIEKQLCGQVGQKELQYFFLLHMVSGICQSAQGGLTGKEFASLINYKKYCSRLRPDRSVLQEFFENEASSVLGKMRIFMFFQAMRKEHYYLAARIMGLR